jgi:outer membrane immunogenic protein
MKLIRNVLVTTVSFVVFGTASVNAADIYTPGPAGGLKDEYVPGVNWTGFYLGAGGGGGATSQDLKAIFSSTTGKGGSAFAEADGLGGMGGFGTVQVGYDRQLLPRWVAGVFFDYDFDSIDSSFKVGATGLGTLKFPFNLTDQWTVGGRVGYLVNPYTLVYGLGGYTEAHFDLPTGTHNNTFSGFSAGAGIETNLMGNWFLKGEYRFSGLENQTIFAHDFFCADTNKPTCHFKVTDQPDIQTGRLVLSYKFNAFGYEPLK